MRILVVDIDSLRADHMSCYGYRRPTTPVMDGVAEEGIRFDQCFVSDAPCLPSRTAWVTGRFGIRNGVVAHGGRAAEPFNTSEARVQEPDERYLHWFHVLQKAGYYTASVSSFAQRHAAWWFNAGLREWLNPGRDGLEIAPAVTELALRWLVRHATSDHWVLHVNYWDAHTPYRTPPDVLRRFVGQPHPDWYDESVRERHWRSYGTMSAQDPVGVFFPEATALQQQGVPSAFRSVDDWIRWIDAYDAGIGYVDDHVGLLLDALDRAGVLEDTAIVITADHGENQGELNVYGDHQTADVPTSRVPYILRWPGVLPAGAVDRGLHYQFDLHATVLELAGGVVPSGWDARSLGTRPSAFTSVARDHLVVSQMAWSCQRSVRFDDWLLIRTFHPGLKAFPEWMLFDAERDPAELVDLAGERQDIVSEGAALLQAWTDAALDGSLGGHDPLDTVLREGGPSLPRVQFEGYVRRLRRTGREDHAATLEASRAAYEPT